MGSGMRVEKERSKLDEMAWALKDQGDEDKEKTSRGHVLHVEDFVVFRLKLLESEFVADGELSGVAPRQCSQWRCERM